MILEFNLIFASADAILLRSSSRPLIIKVSYANEKLKKNLTVISLTWTSERRET